MSPDLLKAIFLAALTAVSTVALSRQEVLPGEFPSSKAPLSVESSKGEPAKEEGLTPQPATKLESSASMSRSPGEVWHEPLTGLEFVWIPAGCFKMGSPSYEEDYDEEDDDSLDDEDVDEMLHEVCVDGFWMGKTEVTRGAFRKFTETTGYTSGCKAQVWSTRDQAIVVDETRNWMNPGFDQTDQHPVVYVTWNDAHAMADWLSKQGQGRFRLPTEAEWEYAARAGTQSRYPWGDWDISEAVCQYANVGDRSAKEKGVLDDAYYAAQDCSDGYVYTAPVGSFKPNNFGLLDMIGNVSEWCEDVYVVDSYGRHPRNNPLVTGNVSAPRVIRGGDWFARWGYVRSGHRDRSCPACCLSLNGMRLVRVD